jgi:hypothetical protein
MKMEILIRVKFLSQVCIHMVRLKFCRETDGTDSVKSVPGHVPMAPGCASVCANLFCPGLEVLG